MRVNLGFQRPDFRLFSLIPDSFTICICSLTVFIMMLKWVAIWLISFFSSLWIPTFAFSLPPWTLFIVLTISVMYLDIFFDTYSTAPSTASAKQE